MRARYPDQEGTVDRDGVQVAYHLYDNDAPTILLLPPWAIVDARIWKAQVAFLARHWRVITFDPRGNGASDRPADRELYTDEQYVGDALAVLDATDTDQALVCGMSRGARFTAEFAAAHPERVWGTVLITPSIPFSPHPRFDPAHFGAEVEDPIGWEKWNARHWLADWPDFVEFFVNEVFPEPHSTKQVADGIDWGCATDGATILNTMHELPGPEHYRQVLGSISGPSLVIQGTEDRISPRPWGEEAAKLLDAELLLLEGSGHAPNARDPVLVNRAVHDFALRAAGRQIAHRRVARGTNRRKRALLLSSPIGLGHVRRDMAIAESLREQVDGLEVDWLTQHPVTRVLEDAGERIHPAHRWLANESAHLAGEAGEHDLHCFQAFREMDEILLNNFHVFQEVVEDGDYDVVIADEAWDVDHFWHEHPQLKRASLAWLTDFVGFLPVSGDGPRQQEVTADYNAEMLEHVDRSPRVRDRSIFVGDPEDVVPVSFGPDLPQIRDWVGERFAFSGYISGFDPDELADTARLRAELGHDPDQPLCIAAVGGTEVGHHLLRRVVEAHRLAARQVDGLRTVLVAGPRIDPASLPTAPGLEVHAYVPQLHRHLAASDLAIVQGGLTTTMELVATRRPFLYFPLLRHFEQQVHVRHRLDRHGAGTAMAYDTTDPDQLADAVVRTIGTSVDYRPVDSGGADRAAALLAELF